MENQHGNANCVSAVRSSIAELRKTQLTRKRSYASLLSVMALLATMWACSNLPTLMQVQPLAQVVALVCLPLAMSLLSLAAIVYFELQTDENGSYRAGS